MNNKNQLAIVIPVYNEEECLPVSIIKLQEILKAEISMSAGGWIYSSEVVPKEITFNDEEKTTVDNLDFLVILGESNANLVRK